MTTTGLAHQIEMAVMGEQTKGRSLHPRDVAEIAVTVVQQWGCPNCQDSRAALAVLTECRDWLDDPGGEPDSGVILEHINAVLDGAPPTSVDHVGWHKWKNRAELVWVCSRNCPHPSHEDHS